jgi:hypothetical protein
MRDLHGGFPACHIEACGPFIPNQRSPAFVPSEAYGRRTRPMAQSYKHCLKCIPPAHLAGGNR